MTINITEAETILHDIFNLNLSACDICICIASYEKDKIAPQFEKLQTLGKVEDTFRGIVSFNLERYKLDSDLRLLSYTFDSIPEAFEIECLRLDEAPFDIIKGQINELYQPIIGIDLYNQDENFLKGVRYYAIVVQPPANQGEQPICFFRSYTQKKRLSRGMHVLLWTGDGYDQVKPEQVFLFDDDIDCISRGDFMFVLDKDKFHQMFHFFEELEKTVDESLEQLKPIPIANFQEFGEACKRNPLKAAKLRSIAGKPYLALLTIDKLKPFIEKHHIHVKIEQDQNTGQEMLVYESKNSWQLLKLLDDDYLLSELTTHNYEVHGKRGT